VNLASRDEFTVLKRLVALKKYDPDLKVYIALGGWAFNDPGPTQTTFSDIARDENAQKKFFKSLVSFMSTWDLDGVDLDWEYPGPHYIVDRGGRKEDFENFPKFMRNLKAALKNAGGGRDGLTITLPASYWYLQHFDIKSLEKHVDWFNMMSYDIHGSWDRFNRWTGHFLNSHTNLTEIKDALDLLWRNDIPPAKVVMGMAFYGRAFTATTSDCLTPGCLFESAGYMGTCSRENGILMNSEIAEMMEEKGLEPTLYKDAAVKALSWDDQWVTYDDGDTFKLKLDFVAEQCLGGVMVWAVSHDTANGNFTRELGKHTNRQGQSLSHNIGNDTDYHEVKKYIDQCKWTNCGETCPTGYSAVERDDKWRNKKGELMLDGNGCDGGLVHTLCCPSGALPSCGWYSHKNGKCDSTCPDNYIEIGSTHDGCKKNYQAACCTIDSKSMDLWNTCEWAGNPPDHCGDVCPPLKKWPMHSSPQGSGGVKCNGDGARNWCCDRTYDKRKWGDCSLEKFWGIFVQDASNPDYCAAACPSNQYRINLEKTGVCDGVPGAAAYCCNNDYYTIVTEEDADVTELKKGLRDFVESPFCPAGWDDPLSSSLSRRGVSKNTEAEEFVYYFAYGLGAVYTTWDVAKAINYVNQALEGYYDNLKFPGIKDFVEEFYPNFYRLEPEVIARDIACDLDRWNDLASESPVLSCPVDTCALNPDYCDEELADPDEACFETSVDESSRDLVERARVRPVSGRSRWYCIRLRRAGRNINIRSSQYSSNGDWLEGDGPRTRGVVLRNSGDCTDASVEIVFVPVTGFEFTYRGRTYRIATHSEFSF
jgi:GH18 family chitinase